MAKRRPSGDGMIRKREDGRWEGRIVVGHKQNGEPIFRYVLAKTQKELLDKLHRDLEAFQDVELTEDSRMTLGEWLDRWMEDYGAATLRPNTLRSYEQFIRCYIKPYLGSKIVSRVTRMDIQKLIEMAVGSLYMFSVPRGYQDGFNHAFQFPFAVRSLAA